MQTFAVTVTFLQVANDAQAFQERRQWWQTANGKQAFLRI
jgi:hypothetical protein